MEREAYQLMNEREGAFWWHVGMQRIIDAELSRYVPRGQENVILDAGCGTGGVFNLLAQYGRIYGIDQSPAAIAFAEEKHIAERIALGSITELPYPDAMFAAVTCLDVLYHAKAGNDAQALREFWRVLRPGGILIVREPAYDWLRGHQDDVVWTKKRYAKRELMQKLSEAGFLIEKASHVNCFLFPLAVAKRFSEHWYPQKDIAGSTFRANPVLNFLFKWVLFFEAKLILYVNFPFGLSVLCIARKK
ncbi:MAG: class I SAM-dependent methyltransferase [Parcubacteria group bacterium]|nr:class I SAM-dependent methyltransferase [Parcubacteria group bacterium]